jgi:hypothetical protein
MSELERILLELKTPGILERAGAINCVRSDDIDRIAALRLQILIAHVTDPTELARLREEVLRVAAEAVAYLESNQVQWER